MRYKCTVAYVGAGYEGWQTQKHGRSVQQSIEAVLEQVHQRKVNITASGRTDAGVSARGQVFMFDSEKNLPPRKWMGVLNGLLPKDIHVYSVEEVSPLFHARHNVRLKKYTYRVNDGPYDVFTREQAYQCPVELDFDLMVECSKLFIGTHDFTSFNSSPFDEYPDQTRTVFDIEMKREGHMISMTFIGKGFLRYMVRMMSAAIIEVGKHKISIEHVQEMMDAKSHNVPRRNAPAEGLTLEYVDYFEMVALNRDVQIREFVASDELPEGLVLADLERDVREKNCPRIYCIASRNAQTYMGTLKVLSDQLIIHLTKEEYREPVNTVYDQIEAYAQAQGISNIEYEIEDHSM